MSLLKHELIEEREYQKAIAEKASKGNTLVVLPTGMGKTLIALFVATNRLEKIPESKILITAPTRPLNAQHKKFFEKFTTIPPEEIALITGKISPEKRSKIYQEAKIITATPQTIENDLKANRISLENFSLVVFDEAHRAVKDYSYPIIAKKYMLQAKNPLILALTASPGGSYERIKEINENLFIRQVEIRTERENDVLPYVKTVQKEFIYIELPEEFKKIQQLLNEAKKEDIYWLREHYFLKSYVGSKKELLELQKKISEKYHEGTKDPSLMWAMIKTASALKIEHALELLETQGISFLHDYFKKLEKSKKQVDKRILKNENIKEAIRIIEELYLKHVDHPKLEKILNITKDILKEKPKAKIIIFANYRSTVEKIKNLLEENGIESEILVGQAVKEGKGMTQQQQIETIKNFSSGMFNVLIGTSISEEGLDIPAVDFAIFYESVPSEIRNIQRRGRVGRQTVGKVLFLITKDTRDEVYFWASLQKERKMKGILYDLKEKCMKKKKESLLDFIKV
ncbi:MAG: helicase-related protein [Candidatus Aenigmatarchaeota archaeon]